MCEKPVKHDINFIDSIFLTKVWTSMIVRLIYGHLDCWSWILEGEWSKSPAKSDDGYNEKEKRTGQERGHI